MKNAIEIRASRTGRLPHVILNIFENLAMPRFPARKLAKVRIRIGEHPFFGLSGRRGGSTPAFVLGSTIYFKPGILNGKKGAHPVHKENFDLTTPAGFALLGHEIHHVMELLDYGWFWWLKATVLGAFRSKIKSGIWWDHKIIPLERRAKVEQLRIFNLLMVDRDQLAQFAMWQ